MIDRRALLLAGAGAVAACATPAPATPQASAEADAAFRDFTDRLGTRSRRTRAFLLRRYDASRLTAEGRVLYEALLPGAEADAALSEFAWGSGGAPYPVTHRNGAYRQMASMPDDVRPNIAVREVNRDTNRLAGHAARGVIAPDFVLDATIPVVETAQRRVAETGGEEYAALAEALARQVAALRELRTRAPSEAGVWRLPDGEAYYRHALQFQLGAAVDPREAHQRALARCDQLKAEADTLLRGQRLTQGDVAERLRLLARDERYLYADSAEGKAQAVVDMNAALERIRPLLAGVIEGAGDAPAQVRLLPAAQEAGGAQGRRQGTSYLVDLGAIRSRPRWTLPSVVYHELIPGHILQGPYERSARPPEVQLRYAQGYSEGWSIYAEQLADDVGAYANDPLARLGYLQWMLFRMARVVADTGIHVMRWSRERAVEEMRALQGDSIAFVSIEDDVVRFCAQPGAFAAQGLAALHIAELRDRLRLSSRAPFDDVKFHAAMLRYGPLSPPSLDAAARAAFVS